MSLVVRRGLNLWGVSDKLRMRPARNVVQIAELPPRARL